MINNFFDRELVSNFLRGYSPTKSISPYKKLSLYPERTPTRSNGQLRPRLTRGLTPLLWNVKESDLKPIKSRSRLDDFSGDFVNHLFPNKSPHFVKNKSEKLAPLQVEKFYNKKNDSITLHREALIKLKKQNFLIMRNK